MAREAWRTLLKQGVNESERGRGKNATLESAENRELIEDGDEDENVSR
jgi:hypothetical protein